MTKANLNNGNETNQAFFQGTYSNLTLFSFGKKY